MIFRITGYRQAGKQASKQGSKQASKQTSKQTNKQTSKPANKKARKQSKAKQRGNVDAIKGDSLEVSIKPEKVKTNAFLTASVHRAIL